MITVLEYAELSSHVYNSDLALMGVAKDKSTISLQNVKFLLSMTHAGEKWFRVIDVDPRMRSKCCDDI